MWECSAKIPCCMLTGSPLVFDYVQFYFSNFFFSPFVQVLVANYLDYIFTMKPPLSKTTGLHQQTLCFHHFETWNIISRIFIVFAAKSLLQSAVRGIGSSLNPVSVFSLLNSNSWIAGFTLMSPYGPLSATKCSRIGAFILLFSTTWYVRDLLADKFGSFLLSFT